MSACEHSPASAGDPRTRDRILHPCLNAHLSVVGRECCVQSEIDRRARARVVSNTPVAVLLLSVAEHKTSVLPRRDLSEGVDGFAYFREAYRLFRP